MAAEAPNFDVLRAIEVFLAVAETGSMTAASSRLLVTQSAISQQIKLLEVDLKAPLFDRQSRPLRLTPAGIALMNRANRLLLDVRETRAEVRRAAEGHLPHLRVALLSILAPTLVPLVIDSIRTHTLEVQNVVFLRGTSSSHAKQLAKREVDIAITTDALYDDDNIERHGLLQEEFVLILPNGIGGRHEDLRELGSKLPILRYTAQTQMGQQIERHFRRLRLEFPSCYTFESPQDLVRAVAAGVGWSIITPSQLLDVMTPEMGLVVLPMPRPRLSREITLVTRKGELTDIATRLSAIARKALRETLLPRYLQILPDHAQGFKVIEEGLVSDEGQ